MYCTTDDLRNSVRGDNASSPSGTAADLHDDQLLIAIERASGTVSAYAGTSWQVDASNPAVTVPQLIWGLTLAFSAYYATLMYRKGKSIDTEDPVYLQYQDARTTLADIASGKISVNPSPPGESPGARSRPINTVPRIFNPRDSGTAITNGSVGTDEWNGWEGFGSN
jgi:hypothetical protein